MHSPYGMELVDDCLSCKLCSEGFFCHLPKPVMEAFQPLKFTIAFPAGATLFVEGQTCRGIYILCRGRVKLSASSRTARPHLEGRPAWGGVGSERNPGWTPHDTTAETGQPCQLNFVKQDDFLRFLTQHGDACYARGNTDEPRVPTGVPATPLVHHELILAARCPPDAGMVAR